MNTKYKKLNIYLSLSAVILLAVGFVLYKHNKKTQQSQNEFFVKEVSKPAPEIKWVSAKSDQKRVLIEDKSNCRLDIKASCRIHLSKKQWLSLSAWPKPLSTNKTIVFTIQTSDEANVPKEIEFAGVHLSLGNIKSPIKKTKKNIYQAQIKLPIFDEKKLAFKATVLIKQKPQKNLQKIDGLVFNFTLFR